MLRSFLAALVGFSRRHAAAIALAALIASIGMGVYVARNISIDTNINKLLSGDLGWRKREKALEAAFPQKVDNLVIVVDGNTPETAEHAAAALAAKLGTMPNLFTYVNRPDALPYFRKEGLLLMPKSQLGDILDALAQAQPMLATVTVDPSLRGFFGLIGSMLQGVQAGAVDSSQINGPLAAVAATVKAAVAGKDKPLNWEKMQANGAAQEDPHALRKYIITKPVLDYSSLEPGEAATEAARQAAKELGLTAANGVHIAMTGSVALNDQEFASVAQGTGFATILSGILVFALLFAAMRTWRIVVPITLTLIVGLIASTAFATFAVGSLNLISVAFAVMFIGIAVDFGIQFGVRYRDQHHREGDHASALTRTAHVVALPLAMAAGSTALGFLAFIPTDYRGVSELGLIAGAGMIIAFILNVTLLPALMTLIKTPPEKESVGYASLAPLNGFLQEKQKILLPVVLAVAAIGLACATQVRFDFDPLDLKDPHTESVKAMFQAMKDPDSDAYAAQILTPSLAAAQGLAAKLGRLPEVDHTMTLASFVPDDQKQKLAMIEDTKSLLAPTFALPAKAVPTDAENMAALRKTAAVLRKAKQIPSAAALADALDALAKASPKTRARAQKDLIAPLKDRLAEIHTLLDARAATMADIPAQLKNDWVTKDGRYLVEAIPKRRADDNPRDPKMLARFTDAVLKVAPDASGTPVSIRGSGDTVISAFVHAGIYGVLSIGLLALLILRRVRDVLLMLAPLLIAGILTLATIAVVGLKLNFANIIALPLLLSLGVSYAVYFVFYWRTGHKDLLQSSMARAVLFSAGTVLVAFMSLCFSAHPGTRGMGELLTIALLYCLLCTFFMLPVLLAFDKRR
ncbi:MAG: MMPL family transporter [Alphaproteobacteria bacterium]|nr:MMPL family transporter [Alphaproteobacteria bacterium]